jgi:hypothetical protein
LQKISARSRLLFLLTHVGLQKFGRARLLAVLLGVEAVEVALAAAVVEGAAALLKIVKVPVEVGRHDRWFEAQNNILTRE